MAYLQKGRQTWWGSFRDLDGQRQRVSLGTSDAKSAEKFEVMLQQMAERVDQYDLVQAVQEGALSCPRLYRATLDSSIPRLRQELAQAKLQRDDVALAELVPNWVAYLERRGGKAKGLTPGVVHAYRQRVESLLATRKPFRLSHLQPALVQDWLDGLEVQPQSARLYGQAVRTLVRWLRERGILTTDPLADLRLPANAVVRDRNLTWLELQKLLGALRTESPSQEAAADAIALCYGAGGEIGAVLGLVAEDVRVQERELYLRGTKNEYRARWVRVADWVWPVVQRLLQAHPSGRLLPVLPAGQSGRVYVSRLHKLAAAAVGLEDLHLHDARHTWAVRLLKAGTPVEVVSRQLGHKDASMVIQVYGRWLTSAVERSSWEERAQGWERPQLAIA